MFTGVVKFSMSGHLKTKKKKSQLAAGSLCCLEMSKVGLSIQDFHSGCLKTKIITLYLADCSSPSLLIFLLISLRTLSQMSKHVALILLLRTSRVKVVVISFILEQMATL